MGAFLCKRETRKKRSLYAIPLRGQGDRNHRSVKKVLVLGVVSENDYCESDFFLRVTLL